MHSSTAAQAGVAGPSEVRAEAVSTKTSNPFTASLGKDTSGIKPPQAVSTAVRPTYAGGLPGLYGGTRDYASCDADKLVSFLEHNELKADAWAGVLGIRVSQIRSYVATLTPVLLRTDTRVTNHGYTNGLADPIQSVLEAGTAVFVDRYGEPVVKCYCGNPLTAPQLLSAPRYFGPTWASFNPVNITVINQSTTIINTFRLYDPATGQLFGRRAGHWTPGSDGPVHGGATTPSTPTTPSAPTAPSTPSPTQPTPSAPAVNPAAVFSPSSGTVLDNYSISVSGFPPNTQLDLALSRPDGVVEHYPLSTGGAGTGSFVFPHVNNPAPGTYSATITDTRGDSASSSVDVAPAPATAPSPGSPATSTQSTTT